MFTHYQMVININPLNLTTSAHYPVVGMVLLLNITSCLYQG